MAMELFSKKKMRIGEMLLSEGIITQSQLTRALDEKKVNGKKLGETMVDLGYCSEDVLVEVLSRKLHFDKVSPATMKLDESVLSLVGGQILRKHVMIPLGYKPGSANVIRVAMADPLDMNAIDDLIIVTNCQIEPCIAGTTEIMQAIDKHFGNAEAMDAAQQYARERQQQIEAIEVEKENEDVANSPIVVLVKTIIEQAAR